MLAIKEQSQGNILWITESTTDPTGVDIKLTGPKGGFKAFARLNGANAQMLAQKLSQIGNNSGDYTVVYTDGNDQE